MHALEGSSTQLSELQERSERQIRRRQLKCGCAVLPFDKDLRDSSPGIPAAWGADYRLKLPGDKHEAHLLLDLHAPSSLAGHITFPVPCLREHI